MTDRHDLKDELTEYADISELYCKTQDVEPPAHLDQRIMMAARAATSSRKPAATRAGWVPSRRWSVPVSLAAVMVLGVGLVSLMQQEPDYGADSVPMSEPASPVEPAKSMEPVPMQAAPAPPVPMQAAPAPPVPRARTMEERTQEKPIIVPAGTVPALESNSEGTEAPTRSAEEWLSEIDALRRQGRNAEAEESLGEFRQQYPDYPVPEALKQGTHQ